MQGGSLTVQGNTTTNGLNVATGDVYISRNDQAIGYVVRPNVAGYKNLQLSVQGSGPLDNLYFAAATTYCSNDLRCTGWVYSPNFSQTSDRAISAISV